MNKIGRVYNISIIKQMNCPNVENSFKKNNS